MTRRLGGAGLALGIVAAAAACGGDDGPADAGNHDGTSSGAASGGASLHPSVEVRVDPIVVIRGASIQVPISVFRVDTMAPLLLELQNAPAGAQPSDPVTLASGAGSTELSLTTSDTMSYGDYTLQLVATAADLPQPVTLQVSLQVRGVPGSLDTSFGSDGRAPVVPSAAIGDALVDAQGRYVLAGGYNGSADNMSLVRLTATGQLDASFGVAGVRRFSAPYGHIGHFEVVPGYYRRGLVETDDGYSLTAFLEPSATNTNVGVHAQVDDVGSAPTFVPAFPPTGQLGATAGGTRLIRDGSGFFSFRNGCSIERRTENSGLDINWGVGGVVSVPGSPCVVTDAMDTPGADGRLFVLVAAGAGASASVRLVTLTRAHGDLVDPASPSETAANPVHLSRPSPAGKVLVTYGTTVREVDPADASTTLLKGTRSDAAVGPVNAKSSLAFYLPDGNVGVVSFDIRPYFYRLSPTGEKLGNAGGTELDEPDFQQFKSFVEAFPDARGGLVVVYPSGTADPQFEHWTIKRFWL